MIPDLAGPPVCEGDHVVRFYDRDETLAHDVAAFLGAGLARGENALVVATAGHRAAFEDALESSGVNVSMARVLGTYVEADAHETLPRLLDGGVPSAARFADVVGGLVAAAGTPLRIYGELVALLWADGDVAGAVAVEEMWNDLATGSVFTLYCAYPAAAANADGDAIRARHTGVVPETPGPPTGDGAVSRRFEPTPFAAPTARTFVTGVLDGWGLHGAADAARLVVTELVTNAVKHARGRFRVTVTRVAGGVRIAVTDTSPYLPMPRTSDPSVATGGRGMHLVAALSATWGTRTHDGGKTVWADLPA